MKTIDDNNDILGFDPSQLSVFGTECTKEDYEEDYDMKIDEDDYHINFIWNLLFNHVFKGDSYIPDGYEYMYLYKSHSDDYEYSFDIGWWVGTNEFQWERDGEYADIFTYNLTDLKRLNIIRKKYSPMTDSEFDKLCDIIECLSNIDNHIKYYYEENKKKYNRD